MFYSTTPWCLSPKVLTLKLSSSLSSRPLYFFAFASGFFQANSPFLVLNSLATCRFLSTTANQTHPHSFSGDFPSLQFYHWCREWNPFNGYSTYHSSLIMNVSLFHPHLLSFHPPCPTFSLGPQNHLNILMISGLGLFLCPLPTVTLHAVKINTILSSLWLTAAKFQSNKQLQTTCLGNSWLMTEGSHHSSEEERWCALWVPEHEMCI